jgi:uncharacterized repeat protein (TIGR01451 family)
MTDAYLHPSGSLTRPALVSIHPDEPTLEELLDDVRAKCQACPSPRPRRQTHQVGADLTYRLTVINLGLTRPAVVVMDTLPGECRTRAIPRGV